MKGIYEVEQIVIKASLEAIPSASTGVLIRQKLIHRRYFKGAWNKFKQVYLTKMQFSKVDDQ